MIQILQKKYQRAIAFVLLVVFCMPATLTLRARTGNEVIYSSNGPYPTNQWPKPVKSIYPVYNKKNKIKGNDSSAAPTLLIPKGGPSQPEMATFKSVNTDNMVNLFTGDFSYNIPLLDVGGYPVNIYYDGNVGIEQEASWVGLGWNINPGSINRNVRGIPDDFNGTDLLTEEQYMKPNVTFGGRLGADFEIAGLKNVVSGNIGFDAGVSVNSYLGPALEFGIKGGVNFNMGDKIQSEKGTGTDTAHAIHPMSIGLSGSATLSSRSGLTLSGSASLTKRAFQDHRLYSGGVSISSSYNSRTGIKDLQIYGQGSMARVRASDDPKLGVKKYQQDSYVSENLFGTTISFARPSYVPTIRMPMVNTAWSAHVQVGGFSLFSAHPNGEIEVYKQQSEIATPMQSRPLIGYMYYNKAANNADAVMDFSRLQDREVTANTPIISAPQYTYDVFSLQGEGTGGTVRVYRTDLGYVGDNTTSSSDNSVGGGVDIGIPGHIGVNFNIIKTPTTSSKWIEGNSLNNVMNFAQGDVHQVTFMRNPGESSVLDPNCYNNIGGTDLVRFQVGGDASSPTIEPSLLHYPATGAKFVSSISNAANPVARAKRSQVVSFLTAEEASRAGLDKSILNYQPALKPDNTLNPLPINRVSSYRLAHHISQINVLETDGKRYVYGLPVYNITQTDFTFSVSNTGSADVDRIAIPTGSMSSSYSLLTSPTVDGYYQATTTPAYAHSFLLSGLLSPDYVDVTGDGITEDDLGNAVKFNYTYTGVHPWRTPLVRSATKYANFNAGNKSETKDDKGLVSYGTREQWYLHSLESKTMIAIFTLGDRSDGKGPNDKYGTVANDNTVKLLDHIDLYNKADIKKHGLTGDNKAKPVKTVHFVYSYRLCHNTPDNMSQTAAYDEDQQLITGGKLTLESIYFTFNGQERTNQTQYKFGYTVKQPDGSFPGDPDYAYTSYDRWGNYKPSSLNPASMTNKDYPYSNQVAANKSKIDEYAGAWALKRILLPSGGQIEVTYESDDYGYVQNKHAAQMTQVLGFGSASTDYSGGTMSQNLYEVESDGIRNIVTENDYVFVKVPVAVSTVNMYRRYLEGLDQLCFKYAVKTPNGKEELLTSYAVIDQDPANNNLPMYGITGNGTTSTVIWLKLKRVNAVLKTVNGVLKYVDGFSPLTLTAMEYLREQLPGQAFPGSDLSDVTDADALTQIGSMLEGLINGAKGALQDPIKYFRKKGMMQIVTKSSSTLKCFVRLNNPDEKKYGGGSRVKSLILKDNWKTMTKQAQFTSSYGLVYDYTTEELQNDNTTKIISSGVAAYEPAIGGEENPFTNIVQFDDRLPWGPTTYGSVEMPILDAFFPTPLVGYSKVTVRSLVDNAALQGGPKLRSATGRQVTEFYTAKDFPVTCAYTPLDPSSDLQEHDASLLTFLYKQSFDSRALSQGFLVVTNDMHGKLKSQTSYSAKDDKTKINYTENFYKNTGANGLNDVFDFVDNTQGGKIITGNMGVDIELMTDTRQFTAKTNSFEMQMQFDDFPIFGDVPWLPFPWPVFGNSESNYRAVTTTKVISYHSVVDNVLAMDKGSSVTTQNLLRDAQTGEVIVTQTNNEFDKPVYSTVYPAYWAYSGMGLAYQNIDAVYDGISFSQGKINYSNTQLVTSGPVANEAIFESGDELLILSATTPGGCDHDIASSLPSINGVTNGVDVIWAFNTHKNTTSLTDPTTPSYMFLDKQGNPYTNSNVSFRIIRSGKRNMMGTQVAAISSMVKPYLSYDVNGNVTTENAPGSIKKLALTGSQQIINASAVEYKEKWLTDKDEVTTYATLPPTQASDCLPTEVPDCNGDHLEKTINPYTKGLLGTFRTYRSMVYYGKRGENDITSSSTPATLSTNLPANGFLESTFKTYWAFNGLNNLVSDPSNTAWVWNSKVTRLNARGMELETQNALLTYTAAQYGYNKTLPSAITNNAAYSEAGYDGFEDDNYDNRLYTAGIDPHNCPKDKHIDFSQMSPGDASTVLHIDDLAETAKFNAHTGKAVLQINANSTAVKTFDVADAPTNDFTLGFNTDQAKVLDDPGGVISDPFSTPSQFIDDATTDALTYFQHKIHFHNVSNEPLTTGGGFYGYIYPKNASYPNGQNSSGQQIYEFRHDFHFQVDYYISVDQPGLHNFILNANGDSYWQFAGADGIQFKLDIYNLDGSHVTDFNGNSAHYDLNTSPVSNPYGGTGINIDNYTIKAYLCKGTYKITAYCRSNFLYDCTSCNLNTSIPTPYEFSLRTDVQTLDYKSPHTILSSCPMYTTAIAGDKNMLHLNFTVPPSPVDKNKIMVFSTWVREDGLSESQTKYTHNQVKLKFFSGTNGTGSVISQTLYDDKAVAGTAVAEVVLNPAGPIIDGWQRYEGYFAAPNTAKSLTVSFVNSNTTNKIYFDDIRIHPFRANMVSYVYDPITQRLIAQLDANNYASFYEYDEEGTLIRTKAETVEGIKTITETRSANQKNIKNIVP